MPEPKGIFDGKTSKAIWGFQHRMAHRLLNVDGKIHPGKYKNRVIKNLGGRLMTITFLNVLAIEETLALPVGYGSTIISALTRVAPRLILTRVAP